jgi:adenylylsulfate kinase
MIKKKNKGIVFWLTGLPGSGKTTISSHLINNIRRKYGPTILISGDDIRKIFHLNGYKKLDRLKIGKKYFEFCRFFSDQGFNVLINVVCLFKNIRKLNRSKLENYIEIFIKTDLHEILSNNKKYFYKNKYKNVWGIDIKPELPEKPNILVINNFDKNVKKLSSEIFLKIKNIFH